MQLVSFNSFYYSSVLKSVPLLVLSVLKKRCRIYFLKIALAMTDCTEVLLMYTNIEKREPIYYYPVRVLSQSYPVKSLRVWLLFNKNISCLSRVGSHYHVTNPSKQSCGCCILCKLCFFQIRLREK